VFRAFEEGRAAKRQGYILVIWGLAIFTIGHSTHPIDEFTGILQAYGIRQLVDVRIMPRSRHNPQFNQENLAPSLQTADIAYRHMPGLGGLRHARRDSINTGWRNASFRGYADYMQTPEFQENLETLIALASDVPTAIMCAEAVPWRCHRSLIADALVVRGIPVEEILTAAKARPHALTSFAKVDGHTVTYPAVEDDNNLKLEFDAP
jgi:uncharacterized protein (DUF488 family)